MVRHLPRGRAMFDGMDIHLCARVCRVEVTTVSKCTESQIRPSLGCDVGPCIAVEQISVLFTQLPAWNQFPR